MSDSREIRRIINLMESTNRNVEIDMDFDQFKDRLLSITADVAREWESKASDDYKDIPASPNTTKFTSRSYNMIEPVYDIEMSAGYQGMFRRKVISFLKIGSNISNKTRKSIVNSFKDRISANFGIDIDRGQTAVTTDGVKVNPIEEYGTSWGGIGFYRQ